MVSRDTTGKNSGNSPVSQKQEKEETTLRTAYKLSKGLGVTLDELVGETMAEGVPVKTEPEGAPESITEAPDAP